MKVGPCSNDNYIKTFLSGINYLRLSSSWYQILANQAPTSTFTIEPNQICSSWSLSQAKALQEFFFIGIRWPLFSYLHHNSQSLIIIFCAKALQVGICLILFTLEANQRGKYQCKFMLQNFQRWPYMWPVNWLKYTTTQGIFKVKFDLQYWTNQQIFLNS